MHLLCELRAIVKAEWFSRKSRQDAILSSEQASHPNPNRNSNRSPNPNPHPNPNPNPSPNPNPNPSPNPKPNQAAEWARSQLRLVLGWEHMGPSGPRSNRNPHPHPNPNPNPIPKRT